MNPANVIVGGVLWMGCIAHAEPPPTGGGIGPRFLPKQIAPPVKDATTNEELLNRQKRERFGGVSRPGQGVRTYDLVSTSTFIQWGEFFTVVPKGAVLHVPEQLRSWIVEVPSPEAKFRGWQTFFQEHRGSVRGFPVTLDQASGKEALNKEALEVARKHGLVVALLRGSPVSVATIKTAEGDSSPSGQP